MELSKFANPINTKQLINKITTIQMYRKISSQLLFFFSLLFFNVNAQTTPAGTNPPISLKSANDTTGKPADTAAKKRTYISFGPAMFDFKLDKGKTEKQTFYIVNRKSKTYQINLAVKDFTRDSAGTIVFAEPGTYKNSCANWISLDKTYVEVGPGKVGRVVVTMTVPDSAQTDEMKWAMIMAETPSENLPPHVAGNITTVLESQIKVGSHVYVNFPGLAKELKLLSFKAMNDSTYKIAIENVGATQIRCNVSIELSSTTSDYKKTFTEDDVPIFPKQKRFMSFNLPKNSVPKGKYTMVALVDAMDDEVPLEAAQIEVDIK